MDFLTSNFIIWKMETEIKEKDINIYIHIIIQNLTNVKHHLTNDVENLHFPSLSGSSALHVYANT